MPNTNPIVFEVRRGSPLPELLAECGYDVSEAERLMPMTEVLTAPGIATKITRQHVGPATVAIYEFKLPFIGVRMRTARRRRVRALTYPRPEDHLALSRELKLSRVGPLPGEDKETEPASGWGGRGPI
jgi:hypothetical protein